MSNTRNQRKGGYCRLCGAFFFLQSGTDSEATTGADHAYQSLQGCGVLDPGSSGAGSARRKPPPGGLTTGWGSYMFTPSHPTHVRDMSAQWG